jgi:hypothetical protein
MVCLELLAGICASSSQQKKGKEYSGLSAPFAPDFFTPSGGWQASPESVAAFEWNGWQLFNWKQ